MAKRLTNFERRSKPGPKSPYPWDEWLEPGSKWELKQGKDFQCTVESMADIIRRHANNRDQAVSVYTDPDDCDLLTIVNPEI